jgi:hypothetical protein
MITLSRFLFTDKAAAPPLYHLFNITLSRFSPLQAKLDPEDYSYNELPRHTIGLAPWLTQRISMVKLFWMEFLASSSKL